MGVHDDYYDLIMMPHVHRHEWKIALCLFFPRTSRARWIHPPMEALCLD